jgi:hypothetical protein
MDAETVRAIGQWIVTPIAGAFVLWVIFHYMTKD